MADNNATLEQVDAFLKEFQVKARVFGIYYNIDKEENQQTLFDLEIPASKRDEYILSLKPEDYYQGPDVNEYDPEEGDVWMFGIGIKKRGRGKKSNYVCNPNEERSQGLVGPCRLADPREVFHMK